MYRSPSRSSALRHAALLAFFTLCWSAQASHSRTDRPEDLAVIVHPELPVDELSLERLRRLYMGDQQFWPGGHSVTLLVPDAHSPARAHLLADVLRLSENQFRQHWIARVFRAETAASPKTVPDDRAAQQLVRMIPGAIALVPADGLAGEVKVLRIDGRLPGDPDYRLR